MKVGFNMLLWTTHVTEEAFPLLEAIKKVGYDGVEIPLFEGQPEHFEKVGKAIKDNGLTCSSVTVIPDEEHNPVSPDAKHRQGAAQHLKWAIDCSAALASDVLCGPFYQPLGVFTGEPPTEEEKQRAAEVHREASELAAKSNVALGVEFLNRFECYFLNTMADAADYVKRVDHPNCGVLYDTFHANIEEKDPVGCISKHIDAINHVHISENDRGTPGKGQGAKVSHTHESAKSKLDTIRKQVRKPADGLLIAGGINILCIIPFTLLMGGTVLTSGRLLPRYGADQKVAALSLLVTCLGAVIIYGVMRMKELENYKWAVRSSILAMLPISPGCVLGVPFGIWALSILLRKEVKKVVGKQIRFSEIRKKLIGILSMIFKVIVCSPTNSLPTHQALKTRMS